jgi:hypothetical protein
MKAALCRLCYFSTIFSFEMSSSFRHAMYMVIAMLLLSCTHQHAYFHNTTVSKQCYSGVYNSISVTTHKAIEKTHLENQIGEQFPWNDTCKCFMIQSFETGAQTFYWAKNGSDKRIDSCIFHFQKSSMLECRPDVAIESIVAIKKETLISLSCIELVQTIGLSGYYIQS